MLFVVEIVSSPTLAKLLFTRTPAVIGRVSAGTRAVIGTQLVRPRVVSVQRKVTKSNRVSSHVQLTETVVPNYRSGPIKHSTNYRSSSALENSDLPITARGPLNKDCEAPLTSVAHFLCLLVAFFFCFAVVFDFLAAAILCCLTEG